MPRPSRAAKLNAVGRDLHRFHAEVISGLKKPQKELPSKYFYDERGSQLFNQICDLDEYYVTRTETGILRQHIDEIVEVLGPNALLIEYGSGSSTKTRILLSHMRQPAAYIPIDISDQQLLSAVRDLSTDYRGLNILPVHADYTGIFELPAVAQPVNRKVVFFPGSTFGNFDPIPAQQFLERIANVCGSEGMLLIGIDLKKDPVVLHRAYNDGEGVTAAFNLNLLEHINRRIGANFQLDRFFHYAFYNPREGRIEMHLVSHQAQRVQIGDEIISFAKGESIWTESSYKYNLDEFSRLAAIAGFEINHTWVDPQAWFGIVCCSVR